MLKDQMRRQDGRAISKDVIAQMKEEIDGGKKDKKPKIVKGTAGI